VVASGEASLARGQVTGQSPNKMRNSLTMKSTRAWLVKFLMLVAMSLAPLALCAQTSPTVNGERVLGHVNAMAAIGKDSGGGYDRVAYTEADKQAREYVMGLMRAAGLNPRIDEAGNITGKRSGSEPGLPVLVIGSHIDSVPQGGNYDGVVGSLGAIEVAQVLAENQITLRHPLEVLIFQNEEGDYRAVVRFPVSCTKKT
jgi:N-carbamoyl-L-amino-acid hydrolase